MGKTVVICEKDGNIDKVYTNSDDITVLHLKQEEESSDLNELKTKSGTFASEYIEHLLNNEGKEPFTIEDWSLSDS